MEYVIRPIDVWPGSTTPAHDRRSKWTFRAGWSCTVSELEAELDHLDAENIVLQVDVEPHEIRLDGMLRATARPKSPRVILSFNSKHGPLSYPCDSCEFWQHNIRSIALALKALRAVDRYGVTKRAEQYRGWSKIAAPGTLTEFANVNAAKEFIDDLLDCAVDWNRPTDAIRQAKSLAHPDAGGSTRQFKLVVAAEEMIGAGQEGRGQ